MDNNPSELIWQLHNTTWSARKVIETLEYFFNKPAVFSTSIRPACPECGEHALTGRLIRTQDGLISTVCNNPVCGVTVCMTDGWKIVEWMIEDRTKRPIYRELKRCPFCGNLPERGSGSGVYCNTQCCPATGKWHNRGLWNQRG